MDLAIRRDLFGFWLAATRGLRQGAIAEPDALATEFRELADEWREDTRSISDPDAMVLHPAYQQIIGFGPPAIRLILRELEREPGHWFAALRAITREDPAAAATTVPEARADWLAWGVRRGYC